MDYEEYMRSVLGYNQIPNNIYANTYDNYYYDTQYLNTRNSINTEEIENMYPEIYKIVYPMVSKICVQNSQRELTKPLLESMTDEIYTNFEENDVRSTPRTSVVLKNGDVRNPNAKEPETRSSETRQGNYLLRDLIKILILRELGGRPNRPGRFPPPPPPPPPNRPPQMPYNQMPPLWR